MARKADGSARGKRLAAAFAVIRTNGYSATTVDDLCHAAGVTNGAFFHHFASKEELAVAAADHWGEVTGQLFATAPYHAPHDPLDRVLAYIDFRREILSERLPEFTCLVGTMVQEVFETSPAIRDACARSITGHAATLEADFEAALQRHGVAGISARSLALHTQAVLQGGFILAKATGGPAAAADSIDHLKRYILLLFGREHGERPQETMHA